MQYIYAIYLSPFTVTSCHVTSLAILQEREVYRLICNDGQDVGLAYFEHFCPGKGLACALGKNVSSGCRTVVISSQLQLDHGREGRGGSKWPAKEDTLSQKRGKSDQEYPSMVSTLTDKVTHLSTGQDTPSSAELQGRWSP